MKIILTRKKIKKLSLKKGKIILLTFLLAVLVSIYYLLQVDSAKQASAQNVEFKENIEDMQFFLGGELTGIKLLAEGVLVVGIEDRDIKLLVGDVILAVDEIKISSNAQLVAAINTKKNIQDKKVVLTIKRKEEIKEIEVRPKYSDVLDIYELGVFVKDSSAGVGTITVYEKTKNMFCGLGHGITETGENIVVKITSGAIVKSEILEITKSHSKKPGDIKGKIYSDVLGQIRFNTTNGIYGELENKEYISKVFSKNEIKLKSKKDIKEGKAYIVCTLDNGEPQKYEIQIEKVILSNSTNKNMIIKVIDEKLLNLTGGIIQGMSGSPIVQDDMLIGAVTHVFLNEPNRGYAVFIENMIYDMNKI